MDLGLFAVSSCMAVVGAIVEKILEHKGKDDIAKDVGFATKGMLVTTVVVTVIKEGLKISKELKIF